MPILWTDGAKRASTHPHVSLSGIEWEHLESFKFSLENVVKVTAYIDDMKKWALFNAAYNRGFTNDATRPARTALQAGGFEDGMCVELDVIAVAKE